MEAINTWTLTRKNLRDGGSWVRMYPNDLNLVNQYGGSVIYIELPNGTIIEEGETILRTKDGKFLPFKQMLRKEA